MATLLKTTLVRINFIQNMQIRCQNNSKVFEKVDAFHTYQPLVESWFLNVNNIRWASKFIVGENKRNNKIEDYVHRASKLPSVQTNATRKWVQKTETTWTDFKKHEWERVSGSGFMTLLRETTRHHPLLPGMHPPTVTCPPCTLSALACWTLLIRSFLLNMALGCFEYCFM